MEEGGRNGVGGVAGEESKGLDRGAKIMVTYLKLFLVNSEQVTPVP